MGRVLHQCSVDNWTTGTMFLLCWRYQRGVVERRGTLSPMALPQRGASKPVVPPNRGISGRPWEGWERCSKSGARRRVRPQTRCLCWEKCLERSDARRNRATTARPHGLTHIQGRVVSRVRPIICRHAVSACAISRQPQHSSLAFL